MFADLVATYAEVPYVLRHPLDANSLRLVYPAGILRPRSFFNYWVLTDDDQGDALGEFGRSHQLLRGELASEQGQSTEQF